MIARASMAFAGQKRTATSRVLVARAIAPEFVEALVAAVRELPVGDPLDEATVVGPVISAASMETFAADLNRAKDGKALLTPSAVRMAAGYFVAADTRPRLE